MLDHKNATPDPVAWIVPAEREDELLLLERSTLSPASYLGERVSGNLQRLKDVDMEPRLAGFRSKPGDQPWVGEHIGKWIHAATLVWHTTGDEDLKQKLDVTVDALIATQEADGYLGTYEPGKRFGLFPGADWDVWTHKYCLIGLLTYYRYTGREDVLSASRRTADLLVRTFGTGSGQRSILDAGTHMGMAATSVLEPIVQLYRHTGAIEYLQFAEYLVEAWDQPSGPRILPTLLSSGKVSDVGNGKAYEMLSNLVGLVELARISGDERHLRAAQRAWRDIVDHHLYVTGTASFGEHFHGPDQLPDSAMVAMGETCVTVTWVQLSLHLLVLTGQACYADEIERTLFNHLAAAQLPDGSGWCYYTPLDGRREYGRGISCCISSGPRGIAFAPHSVFATTAAKDQLVVPIYQEATVRADLGGVAVDVRMTTPVPYRGGAALSFKLEGEARFGIRLRRPAWAHHVDVRGAEVTSDADGWIVLAPRSYRSGDVVPVEFELGNHQIVGRGWNAGRSAFAWGPLVLGYRTEGEFPSRFDSVDPDADEPDLSLPHRSHVWSVANRLAPEGRVAATIAPFSEIGADGGPYRVWVPRSAPDIPLSVFHTGTESVSSGSLRRGSANDYDRYTHVFTDDPDDHRESWTAIKKYEPRELPRVVQAWVAIEVDEPLEFSRVVFAHGDSYMHGGWFDTSAGKPEVQVRHAPGEPWQTIARLDDYPETDAEHDGGIVAGQRFMVSLPTPVRASGLRVLGRGTGGVFAASGWHYATCAELTAFHA